MAVLAMGLAGAAVGSMFGYAAIGWAIGVYLGQQLFGEKPPDTEGPRLSDLTVTSSAYGSVIPIIYGTARIAGNIIWSEGIKETKHEEFVGGKGLGGGQTHTTYTYSCSFAIAFAQGEAKQLLRIWADGKLIYDIGNDNNTIFNSTATDSVRETSKGDIFRIYPGNEEQTPDGLIMSNEGTDIPAHRNMCYVVFEDFELEDFGNRIPNITCEIAFTPVDIEYPSTFTELPPIGDPWEDSDEPHDLDNWSREINLLFLENENRLLIHRYHFLWVVDPDTFEVLNHTNIYEEIRNVAALSGTSLTAVGRFLYKAQANDKIYLLVDGHDYTTDTEAVWGFAIDPYTLEVTLEWDERIDIVVRAAGKRGMIFKALSTGGFGMRHPYGYYTGALFFEHYLTGDPTLTETHYEMHAMLVHALTQDGQILVPTLLTTDDGTGTIIKWELGIYICAPTFGGVSNSQLLDVTHLVVGDSQSLTIEAMRYAEYDESIYILFMSHASFDTYSLAKFSLSNNFATSDLGTLTFEWVIDAQGSTDVLDVLGLFYGAAKLDINDQPSFIPGAGDYHSILAPEYFFRNHDTGELRKLNLSDGSIETVVDWSHYRWTIAKDDGEHTSMQIYRAEHSSVYGFTSYYDSDENEWIYRILWKSDPNFVFERTPADLAEIVRDICSRVNLDPADDVDVQELEGIPVLGYIISTQSKARAALEQLSTAYLFDMVESDYKLVGRLRGRAPVASLSEDEFIINNETLGAVIKETRTQEVELPVRVDVNYRDFDNDYQPNVQSTSRSQQPIPTMQSVNTISMDLPVIEQATFMRRLTQQIMYSMWLTRVTYEGTTSWRWLKLDPADVILIALADGTTFQARVMEMTFGGDLMVPLTMISDDAAIYSSSIAGDGGQGIPEQITYTRTKSILFMLDVPLLRDVDSQSRERFTIYYAMAGTNDGWPGATLYSSSDEINYDLTGQVVNEAAWGTLIEALPHTDYPFLTDKETKLTVYMRQGADKLQSVTKDQVLTDSANAAAVIQPDGETEIIQFQNVTDNGDGTYTIDTLFRGRRGTEIFVNGHNANERIVMLTSAVVETLEASLSQHNVSKYYKGVTYGTLLEDADTEEYAPSGRDLMPWAPVHHKAVESSGDIDITWVRRTRINGHLRDGTGEVPLNEDTEEYELEILDGPGGFLLRTYTGITSPSYTYPDADITTDFGSVPSELTIKVYQISAQVGRGFSTEVTIPVE